MAEKRRVRKLEGTSAGVQCNEVYNFEDGRVEQRPPTAVEIEDILEADGWIPIDPSGGTWSKEIQSARQMQVPPSGHMTRRVTRGSDGGLMEDLVTRSTTSQRLTKRQLRRPENIEVTIEISAVDEEPQDGDEVPLSAAGKAAYRAVAARVNLLAQDRTELLLRPKRHPDI